MFGFSKGSKSMFENKMFEIIFSYFLKVCLRVKFYLKIQLWRDKSGNAFANSSYKLNFNLKLLLGVLGIFYFIEEEPMK